LDTAHIWLAIGMFGQLLFSGRWLLQWLISEKAGRSIVPKAFWYLSLAGGLTLLCYAIYQRDPVFILGNSVNSVIYLRNLFLLYREQMAEPPGIT
jgi:lipid-A-disaccharide synthase-like uncharacterized protein